MKNTQNTHVANNINKNPIQVKMFESSDINILETAINAFLTKGNMFVMDIKYETVLSEEYHGETKVGSSLDYSAMVIYKNL